MEKVRWGLKCPDAAVCGKTVSNAVKGRLIPDDDQYTLGVCLLSTWSGENACHITLLDASDAGVFFTSHANPDNS